MDAYAGQPVKFLGVNGFSAFDVDPVANVNSWIGRYDWTFDVATDHPEFGVFTKLAGLKDTFYVIDGAGKVTLRLDAPNTRSSAFPLIKGAVDEALATVPVEPVSWGGLKRGLRRP